jgi:hypothetical protein
MNRKARSESMLSQLSEEQQETLYDWLLGASYREVQVRLAAPPPEGFGVKTHYTSLRRFFNRRNQEAWEELLKDLPEGNEGEGHLKMVAAARRSVVGKTYDLASSGQTLDEFGKAAKCLAAMEQIEVKRGYLRVAEEHLTLARQQAELEREKFETNTARLALEHAAKLKEIIHNHTLDDEGKIRQSRRVVFTRIPEDDLNELPVRSEEGSIEA